MDVQTFLLKDDGTFPNNEKLPVLYYPAALDLSGEEPAAKVEKIFQKNNWDGSWRNGVFDFHHYHSKSHEVMGIYSDEADLQLGGPHGIKLHVKKAMYLLFRQEWRINVWMKAVTFAVWALIPKGRKIMI